MQVKVEKNEEKPEDKLEITVDAKEFIDAIADVYRKNMKYFSVPGFRKGKVPQAIVEQHYGVDMFYEDAFNEIFEKDYPQAVEENDIDIVTKPDVNIKQMEKGKDLIFEVTVGVKPEVKLGNYKGLEIERVEYPVTDEDVENELKQVQDKNARLINIENRPVKDGDTTVIDFEGFTDGKAFDGGKADNYELVIGSNTFIPGFEEQIIGMNINDQKDVNVKFPDDYYTKELAGKDAVFKVTLHEIKEKELPEINDDFAKDVSEFDTLQEYKDNIKFKKIEEADDKAKSEMENAVLQKACDVSEVEITDPMVDIELNNMINDMDQRLSYQGFSLDQYLKMVNKTLDDFKNENRETAKNSLKSRWVLEAICKDCKIEADEKEINDKVAEMAKTYGQKEEDLKENKDLMDNIKGTIVNDKGIKFLLDNAKYVTKKEEKETKKDTAKADTVKKDSKEKNDKAKTETSKKSTAKKDEKEPAKKSTKTK